VNQSTATRSALVVLAALACGACADEVLDGTARRASPVPGDAASGEAGAFRAEACADAGESCYTCCFGGHREGQAVFWAATAWCACAPSRCGVRCAATLCGAAGPTDPDSDCLACLGLTIDHDGGCEGPAKLVCEANDDCRVMVQDCFRWCPH
jgi:hypothetical protein